MIAVAFVVAVISWAATRDGDGRSAVPEPVGASAGPGAVTVAQLREAAAELGQPIYWAGRMGGDLQLIELSGGRGVQVTYPKSGLTIGTYPLPDPQRALEGLAGRPGAETFAGSSGREVVRSAEAPNSAYFAGPDNDVQVEVYDPLAKRALMLALSSVARPVG